MNRTDDQHHLLDIYLDDHLAGATAGAQRATRLAEAESDSVLDLLSRVHGERVVEAFQAPTT